MSPKPSVTPDFCDYSVKIVPNEDPTKNIPGTTLNCAEEMKDCDKIVVPGITDSLPFPPNPENPDEGTNVDVNVEVCAKDYFGNCIKTVDVDIPIEVKNPCIDKDYVWIVCPEELADLEYMISTGPEKYAPYDECMVNTQPIEHELCGELKYEATYDGNDIDE
jgi:hypothetical protein